MRIKHLTVHPSMQACGTHFVEKENEETLKKLLYSLDFLLLLLLEQIRESNLHAMT